MIHIVPESPGPSGGVFQAVLGAAPLRLLWNPAAWGSHWGFIRHVFSRCQYGAWRCGADAGTESQSRTQTTDNGKQNTYFSSLDNMVAQGNVLPVLYGEMRVGSRVVSQEISTADEGDGGQVVVIGR
ncbi:hypothetical protein ECZC10_53170 [Escherichia coli]|nr:hypothetical protein ECZC10_53170 [Escherichia coli]